jgi:HTH-type transcriptional regulator / antitoxin HigA
MATVQISPIRNDEDLANALSRISKLMDLAPSVGSPEGDLLEILSTLVESYEAKTLPITEPDPIEAIKFRMDQLGIGVKDLVPLIGEPNRVYEVLSKKRPLTLRMIRNLSAKLGIPAQVLIL